MKFHDELNPKLWTKIDEDNYELKSEVADKLKEIADAFIEYLEVDEDAIKDVVITGSSASYNYTPHSDLDLHLKVDYDKVHEDCPIVQGYLWALKASFNKDHDISIYGVPVEVYAEPLDEDTVHNGLYSLWQGKWIDIPKKIPPTDNDSAVESKYKELAEAVDRIEDSEVAEELLDKIYSMRKAGLNEVGEFSTENLAFKKLRDNGYLDKLRQMKKEKIDKQLSLESYNSINEALSSRQKELKKVFDKLLKEIHDFGGGKILDIKYEDGERPYYSVDIKNCGDWYKEDEDNECSWDLKWSSYDKFRDIVDKYTRKYRKDKIECNWDKSIWFYQDKKIHIVVRDDSKPHKPLFEGVEAKYSIKNESIKEDYEDDGCEDIPEEMHKERYVTYFETQEGRQKYTIYHVYTDSTDDSYNELCDKRDNQLGMYNSYKELKDALNERAEKIAKQQGWTVKSIENLGEDDEYYRERNKWESIKEGFNKGDKVQLRRKNNKIGIVKSIFNGDKDKNDKDIKYLDVEFEDGTKEGRPASDFKKVNESIKESEDKLDYEQFKIAKSNFGTYFVTPYDSRIGRIEGSSAVTVSNKLAAAINKYNSKSIAAERKALINKLHKLFKQAGIPKMQDMKSSIRGYRPITQNGYYIEIYKGDYTTFNIGITGNREELGNKIKEILTNEGVKYTGSVDYFTVDMKKQDSKNESYEDKQLSLESFAELNKKLKKLTEAVDKSNPFNVFGLPKEDDRDYAIYKVIQRSAKRRVCADTLELIAKGEYKPNEVVNMAYKLLKYADEFVSLGDIEKAIEKGYSIGQAEEIKDMIYTSLDESINEEDCNKSIFSKLDKLINEAMGETQNKKVKEDKEFIDEYEVSETHGDWIITKNFNYNFASCVAAISNKYDLKVYLDYYDHELIKDYKGEETYNDIKWDDEVPNLLSVEDALYYIGLPNSFPTEEFKKAVVDINDDIKANYDAYWDTYHERNGLPKPNKNECLNKLEETLKKATDMEINEGMWESPFKLDNAQEVVKLLAEPITFKKLTSKKGKDKVWNLIGDDKFWDDVEDQAYNDPDGDARPTIISHLENWIKNKKSFNKDAYSKEAETMIKKAISNFYKK